MKPILLLLVTVNLLHAAPLPGTAQIPLPAAVTPAMTNLPATPKFDAFVGRLQACTGLLASANQWFKVMKPALEELGYTKDEIKAVKQHLGDRCATPADARLFSQRWLNKHAEPLDPQTIFACLPHDKAPVAVLATR